MCSDNKLMVFIKNTNYILVTDAMCEGTSGGPCTHNSFFHWNQGRDSCLQNENGDCRVQLKEET